MENRSDVLVDALGPKAASQLTGETAGASVDVVAELPAAEKAVVKQAFAESLRTMWIMYVALAAMTVLVGLLVRGQVLSEVHVETKTGLDALAEGRKQNRRSGGGGVGGSGDAGAGIGAGENDGNEDGNCGGGGGGGAANTTRNWTKNWAKFSNKRSRPNPKHDEKANRNGNGNENVIELNDCEKGRQRRL